MRKTMLEKLNKDYKTQPFAGLIESLFKELRGYTQIPYSKQVYLSVMDAEFFAYEYLSAIVGELEKEYPLMTKQPQYDHESFVRLLEAHALLLFGWMISKDNYYITQEMMDILSPYRGLAKREDVLAKISDHISSEFMPDTLRRLPSFVTNVSLPEMVTLTKMILVPEIDGDMMQINQSSDEYEYSEFVLSYDSREPNTEPDFLLVDLFDSGGVLDTISLDLSADDLISSIIDPIFSSQGEFLTSFDWLAEIFFDAPCLTPKNVFNVRFDEANELSVEAPLLACVIDKLSDGEILHSHDGLDYLDPSDEELGRLLGLLVEIFNRAMANLVIWVTLSPFVEYLCAANKDIRTKEETYKLPPVRKKDTNIIRKFLQESLTTRNHFVGENVARLVAKRKKRLAEHIKATGERTMRPHLRSARYAHYWISEDHPEYIGEKLGRTGRVQRIKKFLAPSFINAKGLDD